MAARDLGLVTAYAYAVSKGYTGTEEEYAELMASYGTVAEEAAASAAEAAASESAAAGSATEASGSASAAASSASAAAASATEASGSASAAATSATNASVYATNASGAAVAAASSAEAAGTSETNAGSSATAASRSATSAAGSATSAASASLASEGYAKGTQNGTDVPSSSPYYHANSKYYMEQAEAVAESIPADYTTLSNDVADLKSGIIDKAPIIIENASGNIANIYDGANNIAVKSLVSQITPMQNGSGDPSPSNIRPLTGWTKCNVCRTVKNIVGGIALRDAIKTALPGASLVDADEYVSFSAQASVAGPIFNKFKENTVYTIILTLYKGGASLASNLRVWYTDGTSVTIPSVSTTAQKETVILVTASGKTIDRFGKYNSGGTTRVYYEESGIFEGALTIDDFVPFAEDGCISIVFPSEAGTVYGGTIDIINGLLTVNTVKYEFNGSEDWGMTGTGFRLPANHDVPQIANGAPAAIDRFLPNKTSAWNSIRDGCAGVIQYRMWFKDSTHWTTVEDWVAYLQAQSAGGTPLTAVYYIEEPIEYQLTPIEVKTLLGENHIYCDAGDISLEYPADTKLYIQQLTKPDNDMTADSNIVNGAYFTVGNNLYLATAAIAAGEAIVPGANCTATNLAEALNAINA